MAGQWRGTGEREEEVEKWRRRRQWEASGQQTKKAWRGYRQRKCRWVMVQ
jgi:hypothetical protein